MGDILITIPSVIIIQFNTFQMSTNSLVIFKQQLTILFYKRINQDRLQNRLQTDNFSIIIDSEFVLVFYDDCFVTGIS